MSSTSVPESVKFRLWGKAGGRCQYEGCNTPLWLDSLTKAEFNTAYLAHIIADNPNGPRGDPELSVKLAADITNLMLLCDAHHRQIDKVDVQGHPVGRLRSMKQDHERRIEIASGITSDKTSHILLYGANVGEHSSPVSYLAASVAMFPERYPAETTPLSLGMYNSSFEDRTSDFWRVEAEHLRNKVVTILRPRLATGEIQHLSVFAMAPQPLLMLLGGLLSDIPAAEVYQLHREPPDWRWQDAAVDLEYRIQEPASHDADPALVIALSATITDDRIAAAMETDAAVWRITIDEPSNDFLKSRQQSRLFRETMRQLLDRIKSTHGQKAMIHVFPAMPVALAVELGRLRMPKADLPLRVYDENRALGGFAHALDLDGGED